MKERRVIVIALSVLVILSLATVALAQISANFDLSWHVFGSGGGQSESANYRVQDTLGQWTGGTSFSAQHQVQAGFWNGVVLAPAPPPSIVYLPLTLRNYVTYFEVPCQDIQALCEVEDNDDYPDANGPLRSGQEYRGYPNDTEDYFSIYLQTTGLISITLRNYTGGGGQLLLYYERPPQTCLNPQEPVVPRICARDYQGPDFDISYSATQAGWYYIRIYTANNPNSTTRYRLRVIYP